MTRSNFQLDMKFLIKIEISLVMPKKNNLTRCKLLPKDVVIIQIFGDVNLKIPHSKNTVPKKLNFQAI